MVGNHIQQHVAEYGATASVSSAVIAYAAQGLPLIQYIAGIAATISAVLASAWVIYKFYREFRGKPVKPGNED